MSDDVFAEFNKDYYERQDAHRKEASLRSPSLLEDIRWLEDPKKSSGRAKIAIDAHRMMTEAGFNDWAYMSSISKMVNINTGEVISKDAFSDMLGHMDLPIGVGYKKVDEDTTMATCKLAKTAAQSFTSNKFFLWTKVSGVCINSDHGHGEIIQDEGIDLVNIWGGTVIKPIDNKCDSVDKFLDLLNKLMDEDDAKVVLQWLACKVQNPTKKINWSPILVGTKGNGKTTIAAILANIIGSRYSTVINKESLKEKFNGWIHNRCFVVVEEIKIGNDFEVINRLKEYVANERISMRRMQQDSLTINNHADFFFCSNFVDAIKIENDERRWFPVMTRQKCKEDVTETYGPSGGAEYFNDIYKNIVKNKKALESICNYLESVDLSTFNKGRAPESKHQEEFLDASLTNDAFEIKDVIESCELDINGVIFSADVTKHLRNRGVHIKAKKMGQAIDELGYTKFGGRVKIGGTNGYVYRHKTRAAEINDAASHYRNNAPGE